MSTQTSQHHQILPEDMKGTMVFDGSTSAAFNIGSGAKQDCPNLVWNLLAVMLKHAFGSAAEVISEPGQTERAPMGSPSRGGGVSRLSLPTPFSPIFVCPVYTGLSPIFLFFTSLLFATSLFLCGPLETRHVDRVPQPVSLEDGILVIEVSVGLRPLSTNTSLRPGLQLDGRSGRPGLTNRLVAPLLWGCFTGVNQGCLTPEYILSIALVSLRRISGGKLTTPCRTRWRVGSG